MRKRDGSARTAKNADTSLKSASICSGDNGFLAKPPAKPWAIGFFEEEDELAINMRSCAYYT